MSLDTRPNLPIIISMAQVRPFAGNDVWSLFNLSWDLAHRGLAATLHDVTESCATWFEASGASLFLLPEGGSEMKLVAKSGNQSKVPDEATIVVGEGIAGVSLFEERPILLNDPDQHPILRNRRFKAKEEIGSAMIIPLISPQNGPLGVLNLSRSAGSAQFSDEDMNLASSVANMITLSITNARLVARANDAAREARASQDRLQEIIQTIGVSIIVLDAKQEVTNANPQALLLLNEPEHRDSGLARVIHGCLANSALGEPIRHRFQDKTTLRSWSIVCSPMSGGGATAVIEEVTEYEQGIEEMNRLSRLAEIGQMTAAIAHEIRNPLTAIRSSAQMLKYLSEEASEFADIIQDEALKLNQLCDEFLEFARPLALRTESVKLGDLAKSLTAAHYREFESAGIKLHLEIDSNEPILDLDPLRMEQVMRNLLLNGLQACSEGGSVKLKVGKGWFTVSDSGMGMDEEIQARLFTPFFTTKPQGTGLGLSNVRKIVDAHHGRISVSSQKDIGTTFEVQLGLAA